MEFLKGMNEMYKTLIKENILFLGGVFPKEIEKEIYEKSVGSVQNAANNFQWNIISGIEENLNNTIDILNLMFVGSYPKKYKDWKINNFEFCHKSGANDFNVGYVNITGVKQLILNKVLNAPLKKWIKEHEGNKIIIIYSAQTFFLKLAQQIKKHHSDVHICLIIPDLPEYMSLHRNDFIFNMIRKKQTNLLFNTLPCIDSYVLLTNEMAEYLKIKKKPYVVIEGMVEQNPNNNNIKLYENKVISYTGTLTKKYGIMDLIDAFRLIDDENYRLIICGDGEARESIVECAKIDNRIIYKGTLNKNEVSKIQSSSTLLINPRKNNENYTKYSFPSKTLEYMLSETPVLMYKLDGIPNEYDNYVFYIKNDGVHELKDSIIEVCSKSQKELNKFGLKAKEFVLSEKNNIKQCKKIIEIIGNS